MKLRRGCGCPLLILALADVVMVAGSVIAFIQGSQESTIHANRFGIGVVLAIAVGNLVTCVLLAISALRGQRPGGADVEASLEGVAGEAAEGGDAEEPESKDEETD